MSSNRVDFKHCVAFHDVALQIEPDNHKKIAEKLKSLNIQYTLENIQDFVQILVMTALGSREKIDSVAAILKKLPEGFNSPIKEYKNCAYNIVFLMPSSYTSKVEMFQKLSQQNFCDQQELINLLSYFTRKCLLFNTSCAALSLLQFTKGCKSSLLNENISRNALRKIVDIRKKLEVPLRDANLSQNNRDLLTQVLDTLEIKPEYHRPDKRNTDETFKKIVQFIHEDKEISVEVVLDKDYGLEVLHYLENVKDLGSAVKFASAIKKLREIGYDEFTGEIISTSSFNYYENFVTKKRTDNLYARARFVAELIFQEEISINEGNDYLECHQKFIPASQVNETCKNLLKMASEATKLYRDPEYSFRECKTFKEFLPYYLSAVVSNVIQMQLIDSYKDLIESDSQITEIFLQRLCVEAVYDSENFKFIVKLIKTIIKVNSFGIKLKEFQEIYEELVLEAYADAKDDEMNKNYLSFVDKLMESSIITPSNIINLWYNFSKDKKLDFFGVPKLLQLVKEKKKFVSKLKNKSEITKINEVRQVLNSFKENPNLRQNSDEIDKVLGYFEALLRERGKSKLEDNHNKEKVSWTLFNVHELQIIHQKIAKIAKEETIQNFLVNLQQKTTSIQNAELSSLLHMFTDITVRCLKRKQAKVYLDHVLHKIQSKIEFKQMKEVVKPVVLGAAEGVEDEKLFRNVIVMAVELFRQKLLAPNDIIDILEVLAMKIKHQKLNKNLLNFCEVFENFFKFKVLSTKAQARVKKVDKEIKAFMSLLHLAEWGETTEKISKILNITFSSNRLDNVVENSCVEIAMIVPAAQVEVTDSFKEFVCQVYFREYSCSSIEFKFNDQEAKYFLNYALSSDRNTAKEFAEALIDLIRSDPKKRKFCDRVVALCVEMFKKQHRVSKHGRFSGQKVNTTLVFICSLLRLKLISLEKVEGLASFIWKQPVQSNITSYCGKFLTKILEQNGHKQETQNSTKKMRRKLKQLKAPDESSKSQMISEDELKCLMPSSVPISEEEIEKISNKICSTETDIRNFVKIFLDSRRRFGKFAESGGKHFELDRGANNDFTFRRVLVTTTQNLLKKLPKFDQLSNEEFAQAEYLVQLTGDLYNIGWIDEPKLISCMDKLSANNFRSDEQMKMFQDLLFSVEHKIIRQRDVIKSRYYIELISTRAMSTNAMQKIRHLECIEILQRILATPKKAKKENKENDKFDELWNQLSEESMIETALKIPKILPAANPERTLKLVESFLEKARKNPKLSAKFVKETTSSFQVLVLDKCQENFFDHEPKIIDLSKFIGELYNENVSTGELIKVCLEVLFAVKSPCETTIDNISVLIRTVGEKMECYDKNQVDRYFNYFSYVIEHEKESYKSIMFEFLIAIRSNSWKCDEKSAKPIVDHYFDEFEVTEVSAMSLKLQHLIKDSEAIAVVVLRKFWEIVLKKSEMITAAVKLVKEISEVTLVADDGTKLTFEELLAHFMRQRHLAFASIPAENFIEKVQESLGQVVLFMADLYRLEVVADELMNLWLDKKFIKFLTVVHAAQISTIISRKHNEIESFELKLRLVSLDEKINSEYESCKESIRKDIEELENNL